MTTKAEIALSTPPVAVVGATFLGYSLPEWAAIVTIVYTMFLLVRLIRNEWREWRDGE
jgi:disulfide bond formation protein DsbB